MGNGSKPATHGSQTLTFRGVRGTVPTPNVENLGYGGNTPCLEIRGPNNEIVICDAGSGIRTLGQVLLQEARGRVLTLHIFLTHYHWDHIQGLPVFAPLFQAEHEIFFYAAERLGSIQKHLQVQMSPPYFPMKFEDVSARVRFMEMDERPVAVGDLRITGFPLNHPQGASGYRIESPAGTIVYASDLEHGHAKLDRIVRDVSDGADTLIFDAQYTPEEYGSRIGWGHSHSREAAAVASDARVKELILFHHDPGHDDDFMTRMESDARRFFERTTAAPEGLVIEYGAGQRKPAHADFRANR